MVRASATSTRPAGVAGDVATMAASAAAGSGATCAATTPTWRRSPASAVRTTAASVGSGALCPSWTLRIAVWAERSVATRRPWKRDRPRW